VPKREVRRAAGAEVLAVHRGQGLTQVREIDHEPESGKADFCCYTCIFIHIANGARRDPRLVVNDTNIEISKHDAPSISGKSHFDFTLGICYVHLFCELISHHLYLADEQIDGIKVARVLQHTQAVLGCGLDF
jgi:hypothetical protein